ncbi:N-acyl homoserine lactonase family protein [Nonomuraea sp. NPDC050783]|uniref:N-acyl homoserine lactonase family protein n=1 Tax=Nonomuraea sp. NPDC050783 TaxID=3154634 RepID=UPI003465937C
MRLYLLRLGTIRALGAPVPGYLIRLDDGTNVLVDTGYPADLATAGGPIEVTAEDDVGHRLGELGLTPADVHVVICTHLDPDHAGNHDRFPGAEFVIQGACLETARSGRVARLEEARKRWDRPELRYRQVEGDVRLLPGIELVESGGHVPGHQSVLVRLPETGAVLLAADAIPMGLAADPDERPILPFDLDEEATRVSTRKLAELAGREGALTVYGHDPVQWAGLRVSPGHYA